MKYFALLAAVALICTFSSCRPLDPSASVTTANPQNTPALASATASPALRASDPLKRPLDRTREVLGQVHARRGAGEF